MIPYSHTIVLFSTFHFKSLQFFEKQSFVFFVNTYLAFEKINQNFVADCKIVHNSKIVEE